MKPKTFIHNIEVSLHEVLNDYTNWLEQKGYIDTDATCEEPKAVDEYLKENL
jgi:hypothetical protein